MKHLTTIALALFMSFSLLAQVPQAFNYQGVARDDSGNPIINQDISLNIAIVQNSINGNEVYSEIHTTSTNQLGLFSLKIGNGTVESGIFENIDWGSNNYFIQVKMDVNGGNNYDLLGASQLLSVPYALYAKNGSHWNYDNNSLFTNKNVSIGTNDSTSKLSLTTTSYGTVGRVIFDIKNLSNDSGSANRIDISSGTNSNKATANIITFAKSYDLSSGYAGYTVLNTGYNLPGLIIRSQGENGLLRFLVGGNDFQENEKLQINAKGLIKATKGDIFIEEIDKGVIMKSPNGKCWRMTVNDEGEPVFTTITCPN